MDISGLEKNDMLKLLMTQLQNQNPLKPTDTEKFMQQLNSMAQVEQLTNLNTKTSESLETSKFGYASYMVGKDVEYKTGDDATLQGTVQEVRRNGEGDINAVVDGEKVGFDRIVSVKASS